MPRTHYLQIEIPDVPSFTVDWIDVVAIKGRYWPDDRTLDLSVENMEGEILAEMTVVCPEPLVREDEEDDDPDLLHCPKWSGNGCRECHGTGLRGEE